jgi:hypothetical protein
MKQGMMMMMMTTTTTMMNGTSQIHVHGERHPKEICWRLTNSSGGGSSSKNSPKGKRDGPKPSEDDLKKLGDLLTSQSSHSQ